MTLSFPFHLAKKLIGHGIWEVAVVNKKSTGILEHSIRKFRHAIWKHANPAAGFPWQFENGAFSQAPALTSAWAQWSKPPADREQVWRGRGQDLRPWPSQTTKHRCPRRGDCVDPGFTSLESGHSTQGGTPNLGCTTCLRHKGPPKAAAADYYYYYYGVPQERVAGPRWEPRLFCLASCEVWRPTRIEARHMDLARSHLPGLGHITFVSASTFADSAFHPGRPSIPTARTATPAARSSTSSGVSGTAKPGRSRKGLPAAGNVPRPARNHRPVPRDRCDFINPFGNDFCVVAHIAIRTRHRTTPENLKNLTSIRQYVQLAKSSVISASKPKAKLRG